MWGVNSRAYFRCVQSTQVNFQVPAATSGTSTVQVITGCGTANALMSNAIAIPVQAATPEFFYFAAKRRVVSIRWLRPMHDHRSGTRRSQSIPRQWIRPPAHPNEYVTVYGTGFGATTPAVAPGIFPAQLASAAGTVTVTLGGVTIPAANELYAGVTPASPGLYQVNLLIPANTPNRQSAA